jgi:hypothetical protein
LEVAPGLLEPGRLRRLGGEQERGQGAPLSQVGRPQLAGRAALGSVQAGDVLEGAAEVADQVALQQRDRQQRGDEHADQQGQIPLHRYPHVQLPTRANI